MNPEMTFAEFIEMTRCKAIAEFLNTSVPMVMDMPPFERDDWWQQMREYNQHRESLREGLASAKEQGADLQDLVQMLLNMEADKQNAS